jgi:hypothetical protein
VPTSSEEESMRSVLIFKEISVCLTIFAKLAADGWRTRNASTLG